MVGSHWQIGPLQSEKSLWWWKLLDHVFPPREPLTFSWRKLRLRTKTSNALVVYRCIYFKCMQSKMAIPKWSHPCNLKTLRVSHLGLIFQREEGELKHLREKPKTKYNNWVNVLSFEQVTVMDQIICTRRQLKFQIFKSNNNKIGMNTTANKLFHVNNLIGLDMLNLEYVHFKKLAKIQFLKNGNT